MSEHPPAKDDLRRLARPEEVPSVAKEDMLPVFRKKYHLPADLVSSLSAQGQEVVRVRDEAMEAQLQADNMKKDLKALEAKVKMLEKEAVAAGLQAVEDFKNSVKFKMIIQDHVEKERDQILDVEVKDLERQSYEEGFIRGFLKATRVVNRQTGADIEGISPSQASEDLSSDVGDEAESAAEFEDVDVERL